MSKERAARRDQREAVAAATAAQTKRDKARQRRRIQRRDAARSVVDSPRKWVDRWQGNSILARRNRRRLAAVLGVIAAVQILLWPFLPSWGARIGVLVGCIIIAPIGWVLAFGRV